MLICKQYVSRSGKYAFATQVGGGRIIIIRFSVNHYIVTRPERLSASTDERKNSKTLCPFEFEKLDIKILFKAKILPTANRFGSVSRYKSNLSYRGADIDHKPPSRALSAHRHTPQFYQLAA